MIPNSDLANLDKSELCPFRIELSKQSTGAKGTTVPCHQQKKKIFHYFQCFGKVSSRKTTENRPLERLTLHLEYGLVFTQLHNVGIFGNQTPS
jgi:hypothetical protein